MAFLHGHSQSIVGDWHGSFEISGMNLRVGLSLAEQDTGYMGSLDILDQGIYGIQLKNINFENEELAFTSSMQLDYSGQWQKASRYQSW